MIDTRKFLFLSLKQRIAVSVCFLLLICAEILLIVWARRPPVDIELKLLGIDLVKMTLTGIAGWIFILFYSSANSFERLKAEKFDFLRVDILKAFINETRAVSGAPIDPLNINLKLKLMVGTQTTAIYKVSNGRGVPIYLYLRLGYKELQQIFYLPPNHSVNYESIYKTSLSFLIENKCKYTNQGVKPAEWLADHPMFFELRVQRAVPEDFLFDAARRTHMAESVFGDARAFLLRAQL